jgi:hypothetical protein
MLVSDVATRVKRQFGDEVGAQIEDADIIRWCNDAQHEIAVQNKLLQTVSSTPVDLLALRGLRYDKIRLTQLSMDDIDNVIMDRTEYKGTPEYYWTFGTTLSLWPTPDSVKTLTVYYTAKPVTLTAVGNALSLPSQYDNRIVEYCIAQAAELDDNLEQYQLKMSQFQSGIDATKNALEQLENEDQYPFITYAPAEYY